MNYKTIINVVAGGKIYGPGRIIPDGDLKEADAVRFLAAKAIVPDVHGVPVPAEEDEAEEYEEADSSSLPGPDDEEYETEPEEREDAQETFTSFKKEAQLRKMKKAEIVSYAVSIGLEDLTVQMPADELVEAVLNYTEEKEALM